MCHWLIHTISNTININPYASVDGFPLIASGPNIQTHSCNQGCHEQFHVHLLAGVTHDIFTSVLIDKAFHTTHMMSDADVLGFPAWDSSVRPTNPFWNAVPHTETCFLLTTCCRCILMNTFALPKGFRAKQCKAHYMCCHWAESERPKAIIPCSNCILTLLYSPQHKNSVKFGGKLDDGLFGSYKGSKN